MCIQDCIKKSLQVQWKSEVKDRQYNGQIKRTNDELNIEQQETHLKPIDELR